MKTKLIFTILATVVLMTSLIAASMLIPVSDKAKENARAPENSPVITETEGGEWDLERVDFIHYAKPESPPGLDKPKGQGGASCYKLLGVKWKSLPVSYVINPTNPDLLEGSVVSAISASAETWDDAITSELIDDTFTVDNSAMYGVQNFENVVAFGDYPQEGVIGVTSVWYTRRGKQIVEFDILLDIDFNWSLSGEAGKMDLQNIATHEFGHALGLGHPDNTCTEETMYAYSDYGEDKKRILEPADIEGLQKMYGV